jgi:hypothetical protein
MTDTAGPLAQQGVAECLVDAVSRLARDDDRSLDAHLVTVGEAAAMDGTGEACTWPLRGPARKRQAARRTSSAAPD